MQTCDAEIVQPEVDVSQQAVVLIDNTIDASIETISPIVQVNAEEYVLSSGGMYGGSAMVGAVPKWILDAVQQQLTTGDGNLTTVVSDIQALLGTLQTGVSQVVQSLNTLSSSTSSITTALQSEVNQNHSEIMNIVATKVDATQAQAVALNAINSTFGSDVNAYIGNIASTYVDENSAIGQEVNMLTATIGDVSASISDVSSVTVEEVLNPLWIDDGIQTDPDVNGEPRYVLQAKAKKQLIVDANGVVTGLLLESGATSAFTVQADEFKIVATGQSVASRNPFTVDAVTGQIDFVGVVDFTNTNLDGTTTIDGSKITTGSITANQIAANSITADLIDANAITGKIIQGGRIEGAQIIGAVIRGSFIDYSSSASLTNWAFYTPATIPTEYEANFAHDNGVLVVDSNGNVRLQSQNTTVYTISAATGSPAGYYGGVNTFNISSMNGQVYYSDSYTINSYNRIIKAEGETCYVGVVDSGKIAYVSFSGTYGLSNVSFLLNGLAFSFSAYGTGGTLSCNGTTIVSSPLSGYNGVEWTGYGTYNGFRFKIVSKTDYNTYSNATLYLDPTVVHTVQISSGQEPFMRGISITDVATGAYIHSGTVMNAWIPVLSII